MKYVTVESSQIAEVGFGDGLFGPETLGIKFHPGKRSPASEYHYGGVTVRTHQALMAAPSIGSYFGQNIKSRPDLYPYQKVEAKKSAPAYASQETGMFDDPTAEGWVVDPTLPATVIRDDGKVIAGNGKVAVDVTPDSPSTALAVIDTMADDLLFTPGAVTDAQLAAGREWYLTEAKKYDISTEKSRTELKRFARPLQKLRTGIEARAKELTGATKRKIAAIDAEKRRLVAIVGGIEDEVLYPLKEYERAEESRIQTRNDAIEEIRNAGPHTAANWMKLSVEAMEDRIKEIESDAREWPELGDTVKTARASSVALIRESIAKRKVYDDEQAELAKLRKEAAERAEQDRISAAAEVIAAKKVEELLDSAVARSPEGADRIDLYSSTGTLLASKPIPPTGLHSETAESAKVEYTAMEERAADKAHMDKVKWEAVEALMVYSLTKLQALQVVEAIAQGSIPHVKIEY